MTKTLAVDSQYLLKQSFFGNQTTYSKEFGYIGALVTFFTIIRKLIKEQQINKVILFWDGANSGRLRYDIYPLYKSNRGKNWYESEITLSDKDVTKEENADKSILKQRARIQQYAEELFFRQVEDSVCEADDCIAYYVANCMEPSEEVLIYTNDRDFCQLLDIERVSIYMANKKSIITKNTYFLYFDHDYRNAGLIKAIEGCTSDIIIGVEGLKEKGLIKQFPELRTHQVTFEHIYNRAVEINAGRKKPLLALTNLIEGKTSEPIENVFNGKHLFELNYKLVNLHEPFVTDECIELIEDYGKTALCDEDRGGKNLLRLMYEDGFIHHLPGGADGYRNYLVEFLPVVKQEKELYRKYLNNE